MGMQDCQGEQVEPFLLQLQEGANPSAAAEAALCGQARC